jgi:hypothetical protein
MNHRPYLEAHVLELDYQLYWKMMSQQIPRSGYTEMIITFHELEDHVRSLLVHYLLLASQVSPTTACCFLIKKAFKYMLPYLFLKYLQNFIYLSGGATMYMSKPMKMNSTVNYSNQLMMVGTVMKMPWTTPMDCTTQTYYTMMMESSRDMRKVLRRHLYVMLENQLK